MVVRKMRLNRSAKKVVSKSSTGSVKTSSKKPSSFRRKNAEISQNASTGYSGLKGFKQTKVEQKKSEEQRKKRNLPWNFWMPPGSSAKTIILDEKPFFMYEHELKNAAGNRDYVRCIKETGHCPLCSKTGREGYYVMKLTCLDTRGYKPKPGSRGTPQKVVKRILNVKPAQQPKFERIYVKNKENFKGVKLEHHRDGEKEAVIGTEITQVGKLSSIELRKYGEELLAPVDFEKAFPILSEEAMSKMYGVAGVAGSADFDEEGDEEDDADDWG